MEAVGPGWSVVFGTTVGELDKGTVIPALIGSFLCPDDLGTLLVLFILSLLSGKSNLLVNYTIHKFPVSVNSIIHLTSRYASIALQS